MDAAEKAGGNCCYFHNRQRRFAAGRRAGRW
jgi:hypothetical protein